MVKELMQDTSDRLQLKQTIWNFQNVYEGILGVLDGKEELKKVVFETVIKFDKIAKPDLWLMSIKLKPTLCLKKKMIKHQKTSIL